MEWATGIRVKPLSLYRGLSSPCGRLASSARRTTSEIDGVFSYRLRLSAVLEFGSLRQKQSNLEWPDFSSPKGKEPIGPNDRPKKDGTN